LRLPRTSAFQKRRMGQTWASSQRSRISSWALSSCCSPSHSTIVRCVRHAKSTMNLPMTKPVLDRCGRVWYAPLPPASFLGGRDLPPGLSAEGTEAKRARPGPGSLRLGGTGNPVLDLCGRVWYAHLPPASCLGGRDLPPGLSAEGTKAKSAQPWAGLPSPGPSCSCCRSRLRALRC
jgi:hypothetical protein